MAANTVPPVEVVPGTLEELDEIQGIWQTKMSVERKREVLLQQLDLYGLEGGLRQIYWLPTPYYLSAMTFYLCCT